MDEFYEIFIQLFHEIHGKAISVIVDISDFSFLVFKKQLNKIYEIMKNLMKNSPFYLDKIIILKPHYTFFQYILKSLKSEIQNFSYSEKLIILDDKNIDHLCDDIHFSSFSFLKSLMDEKIIPKDFGGKADYFKNISNFQLKTSHELSTISTYNLSKNLFSMNQSALEKKNQADVMKERVKIAGFQKESLNKELDSLKEEIKNLEKELNFVKNIDFSKDFTWKYDGKTSKETLELVEKYERLKIENDELKKKKNYVNNI